MRYLDVFEALNKAGVRYAVCGGVALNLHGVERFTHDLDIIVEMSEENLGRLAAVMAGLGFRPRIPPTALADAEARRRYREEKNLLAYSFFHQDARGLDTIDIVFDAGVGYDPARVVTILAGAVEIPTVSREDLRAMKRAADRPIDRRDLEDLDRG